MKTCNNVILWSVRIREVLDFGYLTESQEEKKTKHYKQKEMLKTRLGRYT